MYLTGTNPVRETGETIDDLKPNEEEMVQDGNVVVPVMEIAEDCEAIISDGQEFEEFDSKVDELVADHDTLVKIEQGLIERVNDPSFEGIGYMSSKLIQDRINSIIARRQLPLSNPLTFSKESYGSNVDHRRETELTIEGVGDVLKSIWEKIKSAIKASIKFIKDFWVKHFGTIERLIKKLESLKKQVENSEGAPTGELMQAPKSMQKAIRSRGDMTTSDVASFGKGLYEALSAAITIIDEDTKIIDAMDVNDLRRIINERASMDANPDKSIFKEEINSEIDEIGNERDPLLDGFYAVRKITGDNERLSMDFEWKSVNFDIDKEKKISATDKGGLIAIIDGVIKNLKYCRHTGSLVEAFTKKFDTAMAKVNDIYAKIDDDITPEGRAAIRSSMNMSRDLIRSVPKLTNKIVTLNIKLGNIVAEYCKLTMKTYKTL